MSITGIICEYNPFHKGHAKLIQLHKKNNPQAKIIAIMSGNITQRGEFPILDKWIRAKLAVQQGVDLVIELPTAFALNSAEFFAQGGVELLHRLGIVDTMICGCEHENITALKNIANILLDTKINTIIKKELQNGFSYAYSINNVLSNLSTENKISVDNLEKILTSPNSLLALAYQQAILKINSPIKLQLYKRIGANHNDNKDSQGFASGTAIRNWLKNKENQHLLKEVLPPHTFAYLNNLNPISYPQDMWIYNILTYKITTMSQKQLEKIQNIREGLEFKIYKELKNSQNLTELILKIKSKRYTYTNIQRTLMYLLLDCHQEDMMEFITKGPLYARILAFNNEGQTLLKQIKANSTLPLITKLSSYLNPKTPFQQKNLSTLEKMLLLDVKTTNLYYQAQGKTQLINKDFTTTPIIS